MYNKKTIPYEKLESCLTDIKNNHVAYQGHFFMDTH